MKKIVGIIEQIIYFPLWVIILMGYIGWSLISDTIWIAIKKRKIVRKIIFSNTVQTWKEKITGRHQIIMK